MMVWVLLAFGGLWASPALDCNALRLPAADGGAGGSACELMERLPADELRREARHCLEAERRGWRRRYGAFEFHIRLDAGQVHFAPDVVRAEGLRRCLAGVLRRRLAGWPGQAELELRLRVAPDREDDFGLQWSTPLSVPARREEAAPLPGAFQRLPGRERACCGLGGQRLVLELLAGEGSPPDPPLAFASPAEPEALAACRARAQNQGAAARQASVLRECLWSLLSSPDGSVRAAAAEEIARRRFAGARRRLQQALEDRSMQPADQGGAAQDGFALLRESFALLRLGGEVPPAVWERLARHAHRPVREALLERLLSRPPGPLPPRVESLLADADEALRLQACELACRGGDKRGTQALFEFLLAAPAEGRARAALLAPACLRLGRSQALQAIERERETLVALLWLERVFAPPPELIRLRGIAALQDDCPAARWLGARLLQGLPRPPRDAARTALPREGEERVRAELRRILGEEPIEPRREAMRLWIEPAP